MTALNTESRRLSTLVGCAILCATTNANVLQTGGWLTSHALLVATLSAGVFAGARVVGVGAGNLGLVIIAALFAGEAYNFSATAERIVVERENGATPLKDAMEKHNQSVTKLHDLESSDPSSPRLQQAHTDKSAADDAVTKEASDGCKTECRRKQGLADKAQAELVAALAEAEQQHQIDIETAKKDVLSNPLPASATPLADRLGVPAWTLDLAIAALLSIGANGLAGALIAIGANGTSELQIERVAYQVPRVPANPEPPKGPGKARSEAQIRANLIAAELRAKGVPPKFHLVRNEYHKRYSEVLPKVTAHRAVGN